MRLRLLAIAIGTVLGIAGCSLTPSLTLPDMPVPSRYPDPSPDAASVQALSWNTLVRDGRLHTLMDVAMRENRDLRVAMLNVDAARSQFRIARAARLPALDAAASTTRGSTTGTPVARPATDTPASQRIGDQHSIGVQVSAFDLDLFGRARALSDAAWERYLATEQGARAARLTLLAAVCEAYINLRVAEEQTLLAGSTLADWTDTLRITRLRVDAAQAGAIDLAQAEAQVERARADRLARSRQQERARNLLMLLVGQPPLGEPSPATPMTDEIVTLEVPAGLPSDLLNRRPDIVQAEHELRAANADVGAARAAFFPRISLTGTYGYASTGLRGLFDASNLAWSFSPSVTQPLFQGGRLRAESRLSEVRKAQAIARYELAVQTAFREVADGLAGEQTFGEQLAAQTRLRTQTERRAELARVRYKAGWDGRLELLDAQRDDYAARQSLIDIRGEAMINAVMLFKALGGPTGSGALGD